MGPTCTKTPSNGKPFRNAGPNKCSLGGQHQRPMGSGLLGTSTVWGRRDPPHQGQRFETRLGRTLAGDLDGLPIFPNIDSSARTGPSPDSDPTMPPSPLPCERQPTELVQAIGTHGAVFGMPKRSTVPGGRGVSLVANRRKQAFARCTAQKRQVRHAKNCEYFVCAEYCALPAISHNSL